MQELCGEQNQYEGYIGNGDYVYKIDRIPSDEEGIPDNSVEKWTYDSLSETGRFHHEIRYRILHHLLVFFQRN